MDSRPSLDGDTSPYRLTGENIPAGQGIGDTKNPGSQQPHHRKRSRRMSSLWVGIGIVAAVIVAWLIFKPADDTPATEPVDKTGQMAAAQRIVPEVLADKGTVVLKGKFGAVAATLELDFTSGGGKRYYNSNPADFYTLKIAKVTPAADGDYMLEITDLLDGRINIGVYRGTFSDDKFSGTYTSNHGSERPFSFE